MLVRWFQMVESIATAQQIDAVRALARATRVLERASGELSLAPTREALSQTGGGFGLVGMRERAEQLGGALEVGAT